jgi:DNA-binding XRE family transcriptional regulator
MTALLSDTRRRVAEAEDLATRIRSLEREIDSALGLGRVAASVPEQFLRRDSLVPPPVLSSVPPAPPPSPTVLPVPPAEVLAATLGYGIRAFREARGWTQADLASATGIRRPNIARLERGSALPNLATLLRVARGLETSLESLLSGRG